MAFSILIVDDSTVTRRIIRRTLELARIPADAMHEAENGREALRILEQHAVDAVIADIHMPVMNGIELMEQIRARPALRDVPVVVISTEGSIERIEQFRALGAVGYIRKPFRPEKVRDVLKGILGDWDDEAESRAA